MIKNMISYHQWADRIVMDALSQLSRDHFEKDVGGKLRSARFRTIHIISALRTWIDRLEQKDVEYSSVVKKISELSKTEMLREWEHLNEHLEHVAANLTEKDHITYKPSRGGTFSNSVEDIIFHVINHATYHRAQLILILRTLGLNIPDTDYIFYIREQHGGH